MAAAVGCGSASGSWGLFDSSSRINNVGYDNHQKKKGFRVSCVSSSSAVRDPYKTLKIKRGASESEVKKAFRSLALKYHPDVCKGRDCGVQFHQIYEAYDIVMSKIREETVEMEDYEVLREPTMMDRYWDDQEEYRGGWEGAWIPSYGFPSYGSHV